MDYRGRTHLIYVIVAPPDQVKEGERIFASHAPWMKATHHRDGEKALLTYNVSKGPELSNPLDQNSAPTGNTIWKASAAPATRLPWRPPSCTSM